MDLIYLLPLVALLSFIAGMIQKLVGIGVGLIVIPSLLSFIGLTGLDLTLALPVLIASCLGVSIPISLIHFIKSGTLDSAYNHFNGKHISQMAILGILVGQLLTIIPLSLLYQLYIWLLALLVLIMVFACFKEYLTPVATVLSLFGKWHFRPLTILSIPLGSTEFNWSQVLGLKGKALLLNGLNASVLALLSLFTALSACIGFIITAKPVLLLEVNDSLSIWLFGYMAWPMVIISFLFVLLGRFCVRNHTNETDAVWLKGIVILYLLACVIRLIF